MSPHAKELIRTLPRIESWLAQCLQRPLSPLSMREPTQVKGASRAKALPFVETAFDKRYRTIGHVDLGRDCDDDYAAGGSGSGGGGGGGGGGDGGGCGSSGCGGGSTSKL